MSSMSQSLSSTDPESLSQMSMEDSLEDLTKATEQASLESAESSETTENPDIEDTKTDNASNHTDNPDESDDQNRTKSSRIPQPNLKTKRSTSQSDVISNGPNSQRGQLQRRHTTDGRRSSDERSSRESLIRGQPPCTGPTTPTVMFADPPGVYMELPPEPEANGTGYSPEDSPTPPKEEASAHTSKEDHPIRPILKGNQAIVKETITARRRREMAHNAHNRNIPEEDEADYLTPSQRKDKLIRFMKEECRRLAVLVQEREDLIEAYEEERDREIRQAVSEKEEDLQTLSEQLKNLRTGYDELLTSHEQASKTNAELQSSITELKDEMERKDKDSQEMYLHMFRKGQASAEFERQEELAKLATEHPEAVSLEELLEKLHETEDQLTFWQSMRRQETYQDGDKPETEAEVKLRFLRDSMFHFLTDRANAAQHLRAMIGIMGFTEVQMKKINKALVEQKIAEKIDKEKPKPKPKKTK